MRSLVTSIFLYACETWTLTADLQKRISSFEMRCYRNLLGISYRDHVTNIHVRDRITAAIGVHKELLAIVKVRKLKWYGHVTRSEGLAKTHPARNSERGEEARKTEEEMGRQRKRMDRVGVYSITESG